MKFDSSYSSHLPIQKIYLAKSKIKHNIQDCAIIIGISIDMYSIKAQILKNFYIFEYIDYFYKMQAFYIIYFFIKINFEPDNAFTKPILATLQKF